MIIYFWFIDFFIFFTLLEANIFKSCNSSKAYIIYLVLWFDIGKCDFFKITLLFPFFYIRFQNFLSFMGSAHDIVVNMLDCDFSSKQFQTPLMVLYSLSDQYSLERYKSLYSPSCGLYSTMFFWVFFYEDGFGI